LLAVVAPVSVVGVAAYAVATYVFVTSSQSATDVLGIVALLAASALAERYPVPLEGADVNGVSIGFVFAVAALVLFGWAPGTFVYATAPTLIALVERRPPIRIVFNAGVFGLVGTVAGLLLEAVDGTGTGAVLAQVAITSATLYGLNLLLISAVVAASGSEHSYWKLVRSNAQWTVIPFSLMASTALMLVVLWQRTPLLSAALVGPLIAISLYQRSTHRALRAMRLALTDPLTGLGNHRHFHERLQRELSAAQELGSSVSLCFLDIDDFKQINDRYGHPAGDRVLSQVAGRLRQGGEAFRLGGDEFAILMPGTTETAARDAATSIIARIGELDLGHVGGITVSAGVATYPRHGADRDSLIRLADGALYWAKEHGKNRVRVSRPDGIEPEEIGRLSASRAARFRAAGTLARAVDTRDTYTGSHSDRVSDLSARIAERMGLSADDVELARLAGSLHDLGKLAIPEEILRKPANLSGAERMVVERHPQIGYRMLESLGVEPIADWVLHHHERWDGTGYPNRIAGEGIPLGARIIFVADAFDAMTSDRTYREPMAREDAIAEVERCAGTQFDPGVVQAFLAEVGTRHAVGV